MVQITLLPQEDQSLAWKGSCYHTSYQSSRLSMLIVASLHFLEDYPSCFACRHCRSNYLTSLDAHLTLKCIVPAELSYEESVAHLQHVEQQGAVVSAYLPHNTWYLLSDPAVASKLHSEDRSTLVSHAWRHSTVAARGCASLTSFQQHREHIHCIAFSDILTLFMEHLLTS